MWILKDIQILKSERTLKSKLTKIKWTHENLNIKTCYKS